MTTPEPLTPAQTISFLLSVIASGERLTDAEVEAAREAARALRTPAEPGLREAAYLWAETPDNDPFIHEVEDNLLNAVTADRIARNDHAARLREDRS